MIEHEEIGFQPKRRLVPDHPFDGVTVDAVPRRADERFFTLSVGIERQEIGREIAVGRYDARPVILRASGHRRQQRALGHDFTGVEPCEEWDARLFAPVEYVDQLVRQDLAVDRPLRGKARGRGAVRQGLRVEHAGIAQTGDAEVREGLRADRLGGGQAMRRPVEQREGPQVGALHDRLVEQPARLGRGHEVSDAQRPGGFAHHGHIVGVASKRGDVVLHPAQGGDLVEQAVVAGDTVSGFGAQFLVREPAERAQSIVGGDEHDPTPREICPVVQTQAVGPDPQRSSVEPDDDGRGAGA